MRAVLMFITIAVLAALIFFAPQGLLTKPHFSEGSIGPWQLLDTTVPAGESADSIRAEMEVILAELSLELRVPLVVQPSLAAARGEADTPFLTGFLVEGELDSTVLTGLPFKMAMLGNQPAIRAEFPYRGSLSIPLGNWKINERVRKRASKESFQYDQLFQLFDRDGETLVYLVPKAAVTL